MSRLSELFDSTRVSLLSYSDPVQAERSRRLLRTSFRVLGVDSRLLKQLASDFYTSAGHRFRLDQVYPFLKELWNSEVWEEKRLSLAILSHYQSEYDAGLFDYLSRWADDLDDVTLTDALGRELARIVKAFPRKLERVAHWVESSDPWRRRLAAVSLFQPKAQDGAHLVVEIDKALELAAQLLGDPSTVVQKGVARLLKYAARDNPEAVRTFVSEHKADLSKVVRRSLSGLI